MRNPRRRSRRLRIWTTVAVVAAAWTGTVEAQGTPEKRVGIGLAPAAFVETWKYNGSTEWLAAG
jgi:hypothetical protein